MIVATLPECPDSATPLPSPRCSGERIRTLIVDDQLLEREVMRRLLGAEPDIEIVGVSVNGREAVEAIRRLNPDLVFLDVQMPEMDGFGVVSNLDASSRPVVVFVTANEEFARKAFDVEALDYLIKPCQRERLKVALERVRHQVAIRRGKNGGQPSQAKRVTMSAERMAVQTDGRIVLVRFADLEWLETEESGVRLHAGTGSHLIGETLSSIEERLPADRFLRISRSAIVNLDHVRELQPLAHGEYSVLLQNGLRLTLTRPYRGNLQRLGL